MKNRKWDFIPFSYYDRTGMERHLEKRAAQGWLLERMSNLGWYYRRIWPRKIHFTVTYYLRASQFDPEPTEEQKEFHDFCLQSGWKLAASSGQMQAFYNEEPDPVPIDTEPSLELERIGKMMKRVLPFQFILLVIGFWVGGSWCWSLTHSPIDLLSSAYNLVTGLVWLMLFLWCAVDLFRYFTWRHKAKKAAPLGEFVPTKGCHKLLLAMLVVTVLGLAYLFVADRQPGFRVTLLLVLGACALLFLSVNGVRDFLKRRKASRALNRGVTLAVDVVLAFVLMGGVMAGIFWGIRSGVIASRKEITDSPLSVEDLTGVEDSRYVTRCLADSTIFLTRRNFYQHIFYDQLQEGERLAFLDYTIVDVHIPFLYDWCEEELLHDRDDWQGDDPEEPYYQYVEIDPAPWGAERAYQIWVGGKMPSSTYLVCWPGRLVELDPDFELTEEQMTMAAEKLAPDPAAIPQPVPAELSIAPATEELLAPYYEYQEVDAAIDQYGNRLLLTTDRAVGDLSLFELTWEEKGQELVAAQGEVYYQTEALTPERPLVLSASFPGVLPTVGVSYRDTDGTQRVLHIGMSGKDGSFLLLEE